MKTITQKLMLLVIIVTSIFSAACWETAQTGTVKVQTIWDKPTKIIRGGETVSSWNTWWDAYYIIDARIETEELEVSASTKDNAALNMKIAVSYTVDTDTDDNVFSYINAFGLDEKTRNERKDKILKGQVSTEAKNAISEFDAYSLLANQEQVQKQVFERLKPLFAVNKLKIDSVQITSRPDFVDDKIESAASAVVANLKLKDAAQAEQEAVKINTETQKIKAQQFADPKMYALEIKKLEVEAAKAWAGHQGSLVFNGSNSSGLMLDVK
jgi:hypothetical protein